MKTREYLALTAEDRAKRLLSGSGRLDTTGATLKERQEARALQMAAFDYLSLNEEYIMGKDEHMSRIDQMVKWVEGKMDDENFAGYAAEFSTARMEVWEEVLEMLERASDDEK